MLIDTHCHLVDEFGTPELDAIIKRATNVGVGTIVCACANLGDFQTAIKISKQYDNVFCTTGLHPEYADLGYTNFLTDEILNHPKVIGVGEIGLDYHYGLENKKQQIALFEYQLDVARRNNMPVAIHTREAESDTMAILGNDVRGVMHCYTSSWDMARVMLDRGFYFSASGIITFKNSAELRETFKKIPIDRIVIETDAPWCAPIPHRGKKCEPFMVTEVAKVLGEIKNLQLDKLAIILAENTKQLYPKIKI